MSQNDRFATFCDDEVPALEQLRNVVDGEVSKLLDGSVQGLRVLDQYVANVTADPNWDSTSFFGQLPRARAWLAVRLAYYLGSCLRLRHGCEWYMCDNPESSAFGSPVMAVNGIELSPLQVAHAAIERELESGMAGVIDTLEEVAFPVEGAS